MPVTKSSVFLPRQQALYKVPSIGCYAALNACKADIPCHIFTLA